MKRFLALILALSMIIAMCGCSINDVVDTDQLKEEAKSYLDDIKEEAKQELEQKIDDTIQDVADSTKDKLDDIFSGETIKPTENDSDFSITMLDVGQGLSILVSSNGRYMLYDGGDRDTASYVVSYLKKHNIEKLDYVVASHYDSDHLNGLVGVLSNFDVDTVLNPDYEADTKVYKSYVENRDNSGAEVIYPSVGDKFTLESATFTVLAPHEDYGDANENSIAIKIEYGDFACVVTGDAETESEKDMIAGPVDLACDLYIVGHHGSSSSSADEFVAEMDPDYAFISCGKDNDYGHPTDKTLNTLNKHNVKIFRSDIDGEVTCYSNGNDYWFDKSANEECVKNENETSTENKYVLNTSSMKFHYSDCSSVSKMNDKNKEIFIGTRDELVSNGYSPCGYCDP